MNLSIIVPNHNDLRMLDMISSIDYFSDNSRIVEIIIILNNPTKELVEQCVFIQKKYKKFSIKVLNECYQNLGYLYNVGIKNAQFDNILFLDSDVVCENGAIEQLISDLESNKHNMLAKAELVYKKSNNLVEKSRLCNTTKDVPPYIPVILIKKDIFKHFKDDFIFAVDTVWCSDAEFANRVLNENIQFTYSKARFYHDKISLKKDIKDAMLYGFGKGIRIKRTKEYWSPIKEISDMNRKTLDNGLTLIERLYCIFWIVLQQISCGFQLISPILFKDSLDFKKTMKRDELFY